MWRVEMKENDYGGRGIEIATRKSGLEDKEDGHSIRERMPSDGKNARGDARSEDWANRLEGYLRISGEIWYWVWMARVINEEDSKIWIFWGMWRGWVHGLGLWRYTIQDFKRLCPISAAAHSASTAGYIEIIRAAIEKNRRIQEIGD
jgi:hypothetical protein